MIELYITHYATEAMVGYNDAVIDCVESIRDVTHGVDYRVIVLYVTETAELEADLRTRIAPDVELVRGSCRNQPTLMNECTRLAKERGAEYFVYLHNDIRPSHGWLANLISDLRAADARRGRGSSVVSPRYIPYHWLEPHTRAFVHAAFWDRIRPAVETKVLSADVMRTWCATHGFRFDGRHVHSPSSSFTTDDGHQLMMYAAAPEFFDAIGGCDESFVGLNYGDCDWGMRALSAGKSNLVSQGCLLGHISGLTFFNPSVHIGLDDNHQRFIAKWGLDVFRELQDGSVWRRLHREQGPQ